MPLRISRGDGDIRITWKSDPPPPGPIPVPQPEDYTKPRSLPSPTKRKKSSKSSKARPLPTPTPPSASPTPPADEPRPLPKPSRPSFFSRLFKKKKPQPDELYYYPPLPPPPKPSFMDRFRSKTTRPPSPASVRSWEHHSSYFPSYQPSAGQTSSDSWFPKFESLISSSQSAAAAAAAQHAKRAGHPVAVYYPDLPAFADYDKAAKGWKETQWGVQGWTGFGWEGERLPNAQGQYFSAPMPEGKAVDVPDQQGGGGGGGGGGKKKKKGKGGGGGGGGGGAKKEDGEGDGDGDGGGDGDD